MRPFQQGKDNMSTLHVVEEVLRERRVPMVVREIVVVAAERLPTKSKSWYIGYRFVIRVVPPLSPFVSLLYLGL